MASLLRQIVAGPRAKHEETGLDLCYVTSNIIATSGPSQTYPQRAYRNPLDRLVAFLDAKHGNGWAIWEFRAEGTGYPDEAVYHRIRHYPWPDHHPPPFGLVPGILGGMRKWLEGEDLEGAAGAKGGRDTELEEEKMDSKKEDRVVVVHCKAGKGRSGTMACSYLIAECGWAPEDALARFTERRMRPGFGAGVSIPSQLRWVSYVNRWARGGKRYVDRPVEIVEVHVWGLRHGVRVAVEGFVEEGKKIREFHAFRQDERIVVEPGAPGGAGVVDMVQDMAGYGIKAAVGVRGEAAEDADYGEIAHGAGGDGKDDANSSQGPPSSGSSRKAKGSRTANLMRKLSSRRPGSNASPDKTANNGHRSKTIAMPEDQQGSPADDSGSQSTTSLQSSASFADTAEPGGQAVIFKPRSPIRIPNSDVNISVERRNRSPGSLGLTLVTAVAHVWFNIFFEGNGPEQGGRADDSGVFEMEWDKMDGIKGSSQRGTRALDRLSVVWRVTADAGDAEGAGETKAAPGVAIREPGKESPIPQVRPADWKGGNDEDPSAGKLLGMEVDDAEGPGLAAVGSVSDQEADEAIGAAKVDDGVDDQSSLDGVKASGPEGEELLDDVVDGRGPGRSDVKPT